MAKEYSVYFDTRKIVITDQVIQNFNEGEGLFIKYEEPDEVAKLLDFFHNSTNLQNLFLYGEDVDAVFNTLCNHYVVIKAAGGLVQNQQGDFLLIKRNDYWDLPKGKGHAGEKMEETALREVSEECGISNLSIVKPLVTTFHTYLEGEKRVLKKTKWFNMNYSGNEKLVPQAIENITEARWVNRNEISNYLNGTYSSVKDVFLSAGIN
jgi:ADP-ribose pyrophosphatase YjhB (NUDIX family)